MMKLKFPLVQLKILLSYLRDRKSFVQVNKSFSELYDIPAGLPQGGLLSPCLFNWFINDIPIPNHCNLALYADDTSIISSVPSRDIPKLVCNLQNGLKQTLQFFNNWKIKINPDKTECVLFTHSTIAQRLKLQHKINFQNQSIEWKKYAKFLGVILDQKLLFKNNIDNNILKSRKILCKLFALMKKHNAVSVKSKLILYKAHIRSLLTYACPVWANAAPCHIQKLQVFQNKCLRMALNAPYCTKISDLHTVGNIETIAEFISRISDKFYIKSSYSSNKFIEKLGKYNQGSFQFRIKHKLPKKIT
jgi:hypothetical protein